MSGHAGQSQWLYAWRTQLQSVRSQNDHRLLGLIKQCWLESGAVYGYRKIAHDLRDLREPCGKHRVYRLMKAEGLSALRGYGRCPRHGGGKPATVAPNHLQRQFAPVAPNQSWVMDITYIRTHEGWLYLAVVLDPFSRQVIGWSMRSRIVGVECAADGGMASQARAGGDGALGSRQSFHW